MDNARKQQKSSFSAHHEKIATTFSYKNYPFLNTESLQLSYLHIVCQNQPNDYSVGSWPKYSSGWAVARKDKDRSSIQCTDIAQLK